MGNFYFVGYGVLKGLDLIISTLGGCGCGLERIDFKQFLH